MVKTIQSNPLYLLGAAVLVAGSILLVTGNPFASKTRIKASVADTNGLEPGLPVFLGEERIGSLHSITPLEDGGVLTLALSSNPPVPADSQVQIEMSGGRPSGIRLLPGQAPTPFNSEAGELLSEVPPPKAPAPETERAASEDDAPELEPEIHDILSRADRMMREARRDSGAAPLTPGGTRMTITPSPRTPETPHGK